MMNGNAKMKEDKLESYENAVDHFLRAIEICQQHPYCKEGSSVIFPSYYFVFTSMSTKNRNVNIAMILWTLRIPEAGNNGKNYIRKFRFHVMLA